MSRIISAAWRFRYETEMMAVGMSTVRPLTSTGELDPAMSVYLNLVRVSAATVVVLCHYMPLLFQSSVVFPGHDAVVVFFVLSGYVIAYVSDGKDRTLRDYTLNRLSRLWSVAVPAVAVSAAAGISMASLRAPPDWVGQIGGVREFAWQAMMNLTFMARGWSGEVGLYCDAPIWSLSYEAWYYAIFGAWAYLRGRSRWAVVVLLGFLAGPIVMALGPIWLIGAMLYRYRRQLVLPPAIAGLVFAATIPAYAAFYLSDIDVASRAWLRWLTRGQSYHLGLSTSMIEDMVLAGLVAANFVAAANLPALGRVLLPLRRPIAVAASYTLSIYLYHVPLSVLIVGALGVGGATIGGGCLALGLAMAAIVGLAWGTEHRQRAWRGVLAGVWPGRG